MHVAGKQTTQEIFESARLPAAVTDNAIDDERFSGHRTQMWATLRKQFPEKMDPTKLEGEVLSESELHQSS